MSANHPPNCPRCGGSGFLNRPTGVGLQTERIPCGVRSQMVAQGGRVPPRRDRPGRKSQATPPKNLAMKTYTVRLFRQNLDDEPAQEWAVVAESVAEAKQALREHFGSTWTWPRIDVAAAAIGPSRDEDSQDAKQYQEQEVDEYLADACRAVRLGGDYVSPVISDPLCCSRNVGEIQMHGAADDIAQQQSYHCDCRIESPILQPIA
jgi:hypothetical protein